MSAEIKADTAIRDQDEAISLSYWLAAQMGEHVDSQDNETLTETVQRYVSREWTPKTGANPTPAPLDPSNVKAGDTVTLTRESKGLSKVDGTVVDVHHDGSTGDIGVMIDNITQYVFWLNEWTLTAHQPAPEPEPEWKPGTVAVVIPSMAGGKVVRSIRGHEGNWLNEFGGSWDDDEVIDVHELVVIDPAKVDLDALAKIWTETLAGGSNLTISPLGALWYEALRAVLAHLGIEATR